MAKKQTSIFGSFLITASGTIILGLIAMYFGYYRIRIQNYETYITELQSRPTPEITLSFSVEEPGSSAEVSGSSDGSEAGSVDTSGESRAKMNGSEETERSQAIEKKMESIPPPQNVSGRSPRTRPSRQKQASSSEDEDQPPRRGPAFPRTRYNDVPEEAKMDDDGNLPDRSENIPDIDDPEMDDNPLIRALREASRRQAEDPDIDRGENPPKNPFEAILNIQDN